MDHCILLQSGIRFDLENPTVDMICIEDIAHALGNICRFTGHTDRFYSVAQHSYIVAKMVPDPFKIWGLLHDAAEAYITDMNAPLKNLIGEPYRLVEQSIMKVIIEKFNLVPKHEPSAVYLSDRALGYLELNQLIAPHPTDPTIPDYIMRALPRRIEPTKPKLAQEMFLFWYKILSEESQ